MEKTIMGVKVIAAAKTRGLSRSRLAAELDITTRTLASRLKGNSEWKLRELVILSGLLDIPLLELVADATSLMIAADPDVVITTGIPDTQWCLNCADLYTDPDGLYI